ncbi:42213_t:CDS:2, partial [Gigaspora margarita]
GFSMDSVLISIEVRELLPHTYQFENLESYTIKEGWFKLDRSIISGF